MDLLNAFTIGFVIGACVAVVALSIVAMGKLGDDPLPEIDVPTVLHYEPTQTAIDPYKPVNLVIPEGCTVVKDCVAVGNASGIKPDRPRQYQD